MGTFNRALWILIALLLIVGGGLGILANRGVFGTSIAIYTLGPSLIHVVIGPSPLALGISVVAALLAIVLGLLLLRWELSFGPPASFPNFHLPPSLSSPGLTVVRSTALRHGLQRDLEKITGVENVGLSLLGRPLHPTLQLRIEVAGDRDMARIRREVHRSLDRFAHTLGSSLDGGEVLLWFGQPQGRRVA